MQVLSKQISCILYPFCVFFSYNSMPRSGCSALHKVNPYQQKMFPLLKNILGYIGLSLGYVRLHVLRMVLVFLIKFCVNSSLYYSDYYSETALKKIAHATSWWHLFSEFFGQYWISFLYLLRFVCILKNFWAYFVNNTLEAARP